MKVLVIRRGALGDVVHVAACFCAVKRARPDVQLTLLTDQNCVPIIEPIRELDGFRIWPRNFGLFGLGSVFQTAKELRREHFDVAVNLMPSIKTKLICRLAGIRAFALQKQRKIKGGVRSRTGSWKHQSQMYYEAFQRALCIPDVELEELVPSLTFPIAAAKPQRRRIGFVIGVAGKRANRAWPIENFVETAEILASKADVEIVLIGGKREVPLAAEFEGFEGVSSYVGIPLAETIELLRSCSLIVGADTGPLHIAASVGVPVIACFGPTAVDRTGPRGRRIVLVPPDSMSCWPCEERSCPLKGEQFEQCMKSIAPAAVVQAVLEELAKAN